MKKIQKRGQQKREREISSQVDNRQVTISKEKNLKKKKA